MSVEVKGVVTVATNELADKFNEGTPFVAVFTPGTVLALTASRRTGLAQ